MSLEAKGLVKTYGRRTVVRGIDIHVEPGEVVGLLGPNGAGKTTSFQMIMGLVRPDTGSIELDGENVPRRPMYERARCGIGYLAQEPSIFRRLSVEQNLMAVLQMRDFPGQDKKAKMNGLLSELGLEKLRHQMASTLSGWIAPLTSTWNLPSSSAGLIVMLRRSPAGTFARSGFLVVVRRSVSTFSAGCSPPPGINAGWTGRFCAASSREKPMLSKWSVNSTAFAPK